MRAIFVIVGAAIGLLVALVVLWSVRKLAPKLRPPDTTPEKWDVGVRRVTKAWIVVTVVAVAFGAALGALVPLHMSG